MNHINFRICFFITFCHNIKVPPAVNVKFKTIYQIKKSDTDQVETLIQYPFLNGMGKLFPPGKNLEINEKGKEQIIKNTYTMIKGSY